MRAPFQVGAKIASLKDPLTREALFLMANAGLGAATGFLFWLVAARVAPPAAVGHAAAVVSAFTLAALLGKFGFDAILIRHAPVLDAPARRRLLTRTLAVASAASAVLAAAFVVLAARWPALPALPLADAAVFVAFAVCIATGWVLDAWFVAERRAARSFLRNAVFNGARLALVALPLLVGASLDIAVAWGAAAALSLAVAALLPRRTPAARDAPLPRVAGTGVANYVVNVSEFLPGLVFPVLVTATLGAEANAAFYVAWTLAAVPFLASKAIAQSTFAELAGGDGRTALRRGLGVHAATVFPGALVGVLAAPWVLGVFGAHYRAAWPLLVVLLVALLPASLNNLAFASLKASDRRGALVGVAAALLALTATGGVALLPALGTLGPGVAWLAANVAVLPWTLPVVDPHRRWFRAARVRGAPHQG